MGPPDEGRRVVVAFVPDLMDRSKVVGAAKVAGVTVVHVSALADLAANAGDLVILDLSRPGAIEALSGLADRRTIGFAAHVNHPLLDQARAAGCGVVMARSAFFAKLTSLLSS